MIGIWQYGVYLFGRGSAITLTNTLPNFGYNGFDFQTQQFRLTNVPNIDNPNIQLDRFDRALNHGWGFNGSYFKEKTITIEGTVMGINESDLEDQIDALKNKILQHGKILTYRKRNGIVLSAIAYCSNLNIPRLPYHITFCPVTITFTILDPFLYDISLNEETRALNTATATGTVTISAWNVDVQPRIILNFVTASGTNSISYTMNGQTITINKTISAWDIVIIDCWFKDVTINSVWWQDYIGEFPSIPVGQNNYSVSINGTYSASLTHQRYNTYV